jgi:hypothetical protein
MSLKNIKILLAVSAFLLSIIHVSAQDTAAKAKKDPTFEAIYQKNSDESIYILCNLNTVVNKNIVAIKNGKLHFTAGANAEIILGTAITNKYGKAVCMIPKGFKLPVNEEGKFTLKAVYEGNDSLNEAEVELQYKDLKIEMALKTEDSVNYVKVTAYELKPNGDKVPLGGETMGLFVPRMFSNLKLAEEKLDSTGSLTFQFPQNIPGDSIGNVLVMVRLEDQADYGYVEKTELKKWGKPAPKTNLLVHRALWTTVAPVWMIVSLTIMLVGVWAHYLYVILRLILIRNAGKPRDDTF